jgi:hypothetical protein
MVLETLYNPRTGELRGFKGYHGAEKVRTFKDWVRRLSSLNKTQPEPYPELLLEEQIFEREETQRKLTSSVTQEKKRRREQDVASWNRIEESLLPPPPQPTVSIRPETQTTGDDDGTVRNPTLKASSDDEGFPIVANRPSLGRGRLTTFDRIATIGNPTSSLEALSVGLLDLMKGSMAPAPAPAPVPTPVP